MWRGGHWYLDFFPMTTTRHLQQELRRYILQALMSDVRLSDGRRKQHPTHTSDNRVEVVAVGGDWEQLQKAMCVVAKRGRGWVTD